MKNILIVDDEKEIVEATKKILTKNQYAVLTALGGKEALAIAKNNHPDLILLDILMPDMDGRDVLVELKKDAGTKDIPIIFVTARGEQFERDYGLELGAYEYISKPCDAPFLLRQVANVLDKSK
jgi:DNA-binding response OmpR family regulator